METEASQPRAPEFADAVTADIGKRIRQARLARGMTLTDLGGDQLSKSFLSLVERGRSRVSLRALSVIAGRLDLPIGYFLASPDVSAELVALALDRAEAALAHQKPEESLQILAQASIPPSARPRASLLRGRALVDLDRAREAVPVLEEALSLAEQAVDTYLATLAAYHLGSALYDTGNYAEALIHFRRAQEGATGDMPDAVLSGKIGIYIGRILYAMGDSAGALEQYERARGLFGSVVDLGRLAEIFADLSVAYERQGELSHAVRYSTLSLGALATKQSARYVARELNNLAVMYRELGDRRLALACAQAAVERAQAVQAHDAESLAYSTLASIYLEEQDWEAAAEAAQRAERLGQDETDLGRIDAWVVLGELAERAGDHARADELYRRALAALRRIQADSTYQKTALAYSQLLRQRGDVEGALEYALEVASAKTLPHR